MTAFCVFGISYAQCKALAEKNVESYDAKEKRTLTQEEFAERVEQAAKELFEGGAKLKQISPAFDAPQFCEDWIRVGLKSNCIRQPKVMTRGVKIDKHGAPVANKDTGLAVMTWVPYAP
jgi:hypothetical protein